MTRYEKRIRRLEQSWPRWPIAVEDAKRRQLARLKVRIGEAVRRLDDPVVLAAQAQLIDDTPAQAAQDRAALRDWLCQHPERQRQAEGARDRISAKLADMARRLEGNPHEA